MNLRVLPPLLLAALLARPAAADDTIDLYLLADVHGATEPCGCTTDPLGDVARLAALVRARPGRTLLLDAGGLRAAGPPAADAAAQTRLKGDFLERTWAALGAVTGVQAEDLINGPAPLSPATRTSANVELPGKPLPATVLREAGGVRIGAFAVAAPDQAWPPGVKAGDPRQAAAAAVKKLRQQGAKLVVGLLGMPRPAARQLGQAVPGIDVLLVGAGLDEKGAAEPEQVGRALLVVPAKEAQRVVRLSFHLYRGRPVVRWVRDQAGQAREDERLRRYLGRLRDQLAELKKDPQADPAYVQRIAGEATQTEAALSASRQAQALPKDGYVTMDLVPLRRALPRDPTVAQGMQELDRRIGEENLKQAHGPPPPPAPGQPAYVGTAGCLGSCHNHEDALEQWRHTVHAHAWTTLVEVGKQYSYECMGCHSTGFGQPGGANLYTLAAADRGALHAYPDLRAVGCENCHGPGSLHVRSPVKHPMPVEKPQETRCRECHTREHSDTFAFVPYLRDILGPGHGPDRRKELGPGVTGAELRKAALQGHAAP